MGYLQPDRRKQQDVQDSQRDLKDDDEKKSNSELAENTGTPQSIRCKEPDYIRCADYGYDRMQ